MFEIFETFPFTYREGLNFIKFYTIYKILYGVYY